MELLDYFCLGYGQSLSERAAATISGWLCTALEDAQRRWPGVALAPAEFAEHVGERLRNAGMPEHEVATIHAVDLFLARACALNVLGAAAALDREHLERVAYLVRHIDPSAAFSQEVRQRLCEKLLVAPVGKLARISSYSGRGPLSGWMTVTIQREALSLKRASRRNWQSVDEHAATCIRPSTDPELVYMRERYREEFHDALRFAIADLSERDRVVLRFNVIDRLSFTKIGAIYGVNQSTVTRWVARTRERIMDVMSQRFRERLGLGRTDLESVVRMLRSELDINVSTILKDVPCEDEGVSRGAEANG